ncbi:MAG: DUF4405 domain-containing protein [Chlorobium sp.]|nr:DUF4405 domain-containing protein [Chlorobiaceae bacterium]MCF8216861.1 DUF4405 domain-containing protein [Chlorobium sp.]MCF8270443.1 DUF4405 domain-containing protein [Chlorobium sp.]MCF8288078.1 DUF4405 domain-containing protein [Chlorobium sp.]MCF8290411.1 DUF4405 domain-containing protein [Chlorobium sp.]
MKKKFSWRIFISFALLLSFLMLLVSGVILYIAPPGRVANWTDWRMLGLTKTGWSNQHAIFGFAFAILSIFHLFFINWKAFLSYLKTKTAQGLKSPAELFSSIFLALLCGFGTFYAIQPFEAIIDFGNNVSASWEKRESQPPVPHAETMTLVELARQPGLGGDADALKSRLEQAGFTVGSVEETLGDIAVANRTTAEKLYKHIAPAQQGNTRLPAEGFGRKTLQEIADSASVSPTSLQLALRQKGVEAEASMTMKTIAEKNGIDMKQLRTMIETMISR